MDIYRKQREHYQVQIRRQILQERVSTSRHNSLQQEMGQEPLISKAQLQFYLLEMNKKVNNQDRQGFSMLIQQFLYRKDKIEDFVNVQNAEGLFGQLEYGQMLKLAWNDHQKVGCMKIDTLLFIQHIFKHYFDFIQQEQLSDVLQTLMEIQRKSIETNQSSKEEEITFLISKITRLFYESPHQYVLLDQLQVLENAEHKIEHYLINDDFSFSKVCYLQLAMLNQQYLSQNDVTILKDVLSRLMDYYSNKSTLQFLQEVYVLDVILCDFYDNYLGKAEELLQLGEQAVLFLEKQLKDIAECLDIDCKDNRMLLCMSLVTLATVFQQNQGEQEGSQRILQKNHLLNTHNYVHTLVLFQYFYVKSPSTRPQDKHLQSKRRILDILCILLQSTQLITEFLQGGFCKLVLQDRLSSSYPLRRSLAILILQLIQKCQEQELPKIYEMNVFHYLVSTVHHWDDQDIRIIAVQSIYVYSERLLVYSRVGEIGYLLELVKGHTGDLTGIEEEENVDILVWLENLDALFNRQQY